MDEIKRSSAYVSEKISKIRWLKEEQGENDKFVSGSWDSQTNHIKLWGLVPNEYSSGENDFLPKCCCKLSVKGDVSGLEVLSNDKLVASSTHGCINLIEVNRSINKINLVKSSGLIHKFKDDSPAPCTALAVSCGDVTTIGEDGRINLLRPSHTRLDLIKSIENADSCSLTTVSMLNINEVLAGNRMGVVKMFDIRSNDNRPIESFLISCADERQSYSVTGITYHPDQKHIIFFGNEEGSITVFDLRNPNFPASYLSAHKGAISELAFHRSDSTKMLTASENGELWLWSQNILQMAAENLTKDAENISPWLNGERAKSKINVTTLVSDREIRKAINSFDTLGSKLIFGSDNEAVHYIENLY